MDTALAFRKTQRRPDMNEHSQTSALEEHTIQQIPREQRHGKASDLFTIWFGANIMLLTVVTGALAV